MTKWLFNLFNPAAEPLESLDFIKLDFDRNQDTLSEKRRAAIEWLGEHWILHPKNSIKKQGVRDSTLTR